MSREADVVHGHPDGDLDALIESLHAASLETRSMRAPAATTWLGSLERSTHWQTLPSSTSWWTGFSPVRAGSTRSSRCCATPRSPRSWSTAAGRCGSSVVVRSKRRRFGSPLDAYQLIERVVTPLGLRIDRTSPLIDARLLDGSRVNVVIPPLAIDGPCITIRRFGPRAIGLHELCPPGVAELLAWSVRRRSNILVSGGTGAGKTTLLNALAGGDFDW